MVTVGKLYQKLTLGQKQPRKEPFQVVIVELRPGVKLCSAGMSSSKSKRLQLTEIEMKLLLMLGQ